MEPSNILEEIMESKGAQGSDGTEFVRTARVLYRTRPSKMVKGVRDMIIASRGLHISYFRMNVKEMLKGTPDITYNPKDLPSEIVQRFMGLRTMADLKVSKMKYDKKRRKFFFVISAVRNSNVFYGGGRQYVNVKEYMLEVSITDLSSVMELPV